MLIDFAHVARWANREICVTQVVLHFGVSHAAMSKTTKKQIQSEHQSSIDSFLKPVRFKLPYRIIEPAFAWCR